MNGLLTMRPLALILVGLFTAAAGCGESGKDPSSSDSKPQSATQSSVSELEVLEAPPQLSSIRFRAKWITPNPGDCGNTSENLGTHNWGMGVLIGSEEPLGESSVGPTANFGCGLGEQPPTPDCNTARTISYPDPVTGDCPPPDAPDECVPPLCVGSGATQSDDFMRTANVSGDTTIRVDLREGTLDNTEDIFFELDVDAETRTVTPGDRHSRVDTLTSECVTWTNGEINWEFCFEVELIETIYCGGENTACRRQGTRVHQGGMTIDDCTPAPVIDFLTPCPMPASTFTTAGLDDTDSDGIPDLWETNGFDANCDGDVTDAVDLPFHVWGANPQHKDIFVEFDWMTGEEPRRGNIQAMKDAFAKAPVDAGGTLNPDGLPGINLFVDTGALLDPVAGAAVGDNLGGGNAMAPQSISRLDSRFFATKCANFNPIRERFFRYGISARHGCRDPNLTEDGGMAGTCQNSIDDGADGMDAADPDCAAGGPGFEDGSTDPVSCVDFRDNGADGANCADRECNFDPGAAEDGVVAGSCSNGLDDDDDGKVDSADDTCGYANGITDLENGFLDFSHFGITIMHELGHMLGLDHGGPYVGTPFNEHAQDRKPNYLSIMHNGNWPGIRLRTSEDTSLVANSCFDGLDNGGMGDGIDTGDSNCQVGHDVWGPGGLPDGIPDGVILDYSPPQRPDGQRAKLPDLNEQMLSEATGLDLLDSRHLFRYVGFMPQFAEDGMNSCGDGIDNGDDDGFDTTDSDCYFGTIFQRGFPEDDVRFCDDGIDNGTTKTPPDDADGADGGDKQDCRWVFINAVDGDNDGVGGPDPLAIDWQRDSVLNLPTVAVDINADNDLFDFWNPAENLRGADDWRNLDIRPAGLGGTPALQVVHEPTIQEVEAQLRHERGTDLGISFNELPTGISAGQPVLVSVAVTNLGPRPAAEYRAVLHLPPGVWLDDPNCGQVGPRVECPGSNLGVLDADVFTVTIRIGPNPVSAVRTLAAEVEVVDAENLNTANNLFGRLLVEPSAGCDPQAPFEAPVAAFTGSMDADGLTFSADGQTAYISGAGPGGRDIYIATRGPNGNFNTPEPVTILNTNFIERSPSLSPDGRLYFTKQPSFLFEIGRGLGTAPAFTGAEVDSAISSPQQDEDPFWWGNNTLYFVSERPLGDHRDVWVATWNGNAFNSPTKIPGPVNSTYEEYHPVVSPDGLRIYFGSRRYGFANDTSGDIFMAQWDNTTQQFANVVNLAGFNSTGVDFPVTISANGCTLYFASNEETGLGTSPNFRLYQATRGASTPAQVTLRLNILGQGSVTQAPFNCGPGNSGTCSASASPNTTMLVWASGQAQWTGSCTGNGGQPSTDGLLAFSQNAVCTIKFPNAPLAGQGGLCSLSMDCQAGLKCLNNTCG